MNPTFQPRAWRRTLVLFVGGAVISVGTACSAPSADSSTSAASSALATPSSSAQSVPSDAVLRNFEPSGDFILTIAGKEQPQAEIYFSEGARAFVLITSEFASPILVSASTQSVDTVDLMKVAKQPSGSLDLLADAVLQSAGKYRADGPNIEFTYEGKILRLVPRPALVGQRTGAELLADNPLYVRRARDYNPDAGIMKRLKAQKEPVRVLTFFGSWCSHCKRHVPLLLKVEQGLAGSKFQFEYVGMPQGAEFAKVPEGQRYNVTGVPTSILFVGGKEIGRIPNAQWSNPEVALDLQINGPKASK